MIKIKNLILAFLSAIFVIFAFSKVDLIVDLVKSFLEPERKVIIEPSNNYTKNIDYLFVKKSTDYEPHSYDDLINIFYSLLDNGWLEFTFYCPLDYTECLDDVSKLSNDKVLLSDINNYVHPYNSYSSIRTIFDETGEVTIFVNKLYSSTEIIDLNKEIDKIMNELIKDNMSDVDKIKALHDYIVMHTTYDTDRSDKGNSNYDSARMTGALFEHYAICSGYTDLMAVMLDKMDIPNFKVASETHIWNAVFVNGSWLHLDLTWDDPISVTGEENYDDSFFLIDTNTLRDKDNKSTDHVFNIDRYLEFN
ncbi:MAG TPA: hypothetical protein DCE23_00455 [Firmicutes bacterium]|nr:hypothetical protein [Bacillota bacterium]